MGIPFLTIAARPLTGVLPILLLCPTLSAQIPAWAFNIGSTGYEETRGIAVTDEGHVVITGEFELTVDFDPGPGTFELTSQGYSDAFVARYTNDGRLLHAVSFAGNMASQGYGVAVGPDGTVFTTGIFTGTVDLDPGPGTDQRTSSGYYDVYLCALDRDGNLLWADVIGGPGNEETRSVAVGLDGNPCIAGEIHGSFDADPGPAVHPVDSIGSFDAFVAKYQGSDGALLWAHAIGGAGDDRAYDAAVRPDGTAIVTGYFGGTMDLDPGPGQYLATAAGQWSDAFVACYGPAGNFLWGDGMGSDGTDSGRGVALDSLGNTVVVGRFTRVAYFGTGTDLDSLVCTGPTGDADIFLAKYGPTGSLLWVKGIGGPQENMPRGTATDHQGNILVAGRTKGTIDFDPGPGTALATANGVFDGFLAKYSPQGDHIWGFTVGASYHTRGLNVTTDAVGSAYLTGWFTENVDLDPGPDTLLLVNHGEMDAYLAKYSDLPLHELQLSIQLDDQPSATGWAVRDLADDRALFTGAARATDASLEIADTWQVPDGCYRLVVTDADGNGIDGGGYVLTGDSLPLLLASGDFGAESALQGADGSCLPLGQAALTPGDCTQELFDAGDTLHINPVPGATGYTLWFFDPHGTYSGPVFSPTDAFPLGLMPPGTPTLLPLNVRAAAWLNGTPAAFGPACRIRFDGTIGWAETPLATASLALAPNPAAGGKAQLRATGLPDGNWPLVVTDALGRTVHRATLHSANGRAEQLLFSHKVTPGLYQVTLMLPGGPLTVRLSATP